MTGANDNFGHNAGDELPATLAARLRRETRPGDTLVRLGGDEFAILVEDLGPAEAVAEGGGLIVPVVAAAL
ncbi:MAG: diguanylate cyclase [Actinoplanes sp.]